MSRSGSSPWMTRTYAPGRLAPFAILDCDYPEGCARESVIFPYDGGLAR